MSHGTMSQPSNPVYPFIAIPALDDTFGAVLVGTFIALMLYDAGMSSSFYEFDPALTMGNWKVGAVIVLETFHSLINVHICYYYLTASYFKPFNLLYGNWSIDAVVILASQSFFARRVVAVGGRYRWIAGIAIILLLGELGFYTAATVKAFNLPTFKDFRTWFISTGSAMAVTADLLLTGVLILSLRRSRTGFKQTDSTIDVLILYSINTGLITGLCNVLAFLFALILPYDLIYAAVGDRGDQAVRDDATSCSLAARGTLTFGLTQVEIVDIRPSIALSMVQRPAAISSNSERTSPPECCLPQIPMEPPISAENTVWTHEGRDALDCV
ncbi:hypothetical protein OH76DRAFT_1488381 [Lentinus brumalis]|uniref:DUF6534 domain-containing protein n=1 Tax=Lentinus brumalis TaxID=2498619 RepID=A0A371CR39_9APHY|nr:hypothetical protein OH76DRAFT_1488381 [Polyporus brumalis]